MGKKVTTVGNLSNNEGSSIIGRMAIYLKDQTDLDTHSDFFVGDVIKFEKHDGTACPYRARVIKGRLPNNTGWLNRGRRVALLPAGYDISQESQEWSDQMTVAEAIVEFGKRGLLEKTVRLHTDTDRFRAGDICVVKVVENGRAPISILKVGSESGWAPGMGWWVNDDRIVSVRLDK